MNGPADPVIDDGPCSPFIENKGQWSKGFLFIAQTRYGYVGLLEDGVLHCIASEDGTETLRVTFAGGRPASINGEGAGATEYNFFLGSDRSRWASGCSGFGSVIYEKVWPGIDMVFYREDGAMKYDLIVGPGSDPSSIRMDVEGASAISVRGDTLFMTSGELVTMTDSGLKAYYSDDLTPVGASFKVQGMSFGFDLGRYDSSRTVVIDPVVNRAMMEFSTYLGGSGDDTGSEVRRDRSGNIYISGYTASIDLPTGPGPYQASNNGYFDCFVSKMDPTGSTLLASTYFGGSSWDYCYSMELDEGGDCYMTGATFSTDFPVTEGAYSDGPSAGSWDIFLMKMSGDLTSLLASTYFGGSDYESCDAIGIGPDGRAYVTGTTSSSDLPLTSNAFQDTISPYAYGAPVDLFIMGMDLVNMTLTYSTYLGGTGFEDACDLVIDSAGSVLVCGMTDSLDFNVTSGAYCTTPTWNDAFLLKMDPASGTLIYSTYFGGSSGASISSIGIDRAGNVYGVGFTGSNNLPVTAGAVDPTFSGGWQDGFVVCFDPTMSRVLYCTYIGGSSEERIETVMVDDLGYLHMTGFTDSTDLPSVPLSFQTTFGGGEGDVFYMKINGNLSSLAYSTFIGGNKMEWDVGVELDRSSGGPVIAVSTASTDLPTTEGCYRSRYIGEDDLFIIGLNLTLPPSQPTDLAAVPGDSFVDLEWGPPLKDGGAPISGYEVLRGTEEWDLDVIGQGLTGLSFNDTGVKNGVTYFYGVRARNRMGPGSLSRTVRALPCALPSPPVNVRAVYGNARVDISWSPPEQCGGLVMTGYRIYRSTSGAEHVLLAELMDDARDHTDLDVENGVTYGYGLTALNVLGESVRSPIVNVTPCTRPGKVTGLSAVAGPGYTTISWSPPASDGGSPLLTYVLCRAEGTKALSRHMTFDASTLSWNDTGLRNGTTYRYTVAASNKEGAGDPSDEAKAIPLGRPSPPVKLSGEPGSGRVTLSWGKPWDDGGAPVTGYAVHRTKDGTWSMIGQVGSDALPYIDTDVVNGVAYTYRVTAFNAVGESAPSGTLELIPVGVPGAPAELTAVPGDGSVVLSWVMPSDDGGAPVSEFFIYRGLSPSMMSFYRSVNGSVATIDDTSVTNGETYHYSVSSLNMVGEGPRSETLSATPLGLPDPPINIRLSPSDGIVIISWDRPRDDGGADIEAVNIYRRAGDSQFAPVSTGGPAQGPFEDASVTNGVLYTYVLTSTNDVGEGVASSPFSATPTGRPSRPMNVSVRAVDGAVLLEWAPPLDDGGSPVTAYRVYRSAGNGDRTMIEEVSPMNLSFTDGKATPGTEYWYALSAVNENGEGEPSEASSATVHVKEGFDPVPFIVIGALAALLVAISALAIYLLLRKDRKVVGPMMTPPMGQYPPMGPHAPQAQVPPWPYPVPMQGPVAMLPAPGQAPVQYYGQDTTFQGP